MADVKIDQTGTEAMVDSSLQSTLAAAVKTYKSGTPIVQSVVVDLMPELSIQISVLMIDTPTPPAGG